MRSSILLLLPLAVACRPDPGGDSGGGDTIGQDSGVGDTDTDTDVDTDTDTDVDTDSDSDVPADADGDGYGEDVDCDDTNDAVNPGAAEACNDLDDDCDDEIDEAGATGETTWYADVDGDGFGDEAAPQVGCAPEGDNVDNADDCDDNNSEVRPDATEACNDIDDDCDDDIDEAGATGETTTYADADGDGFGDPDSGQTSCIHTDDRIPDNTDCDDTTDAVSPTAVETCNDVDDDCSGTADDAEAIGTASSCAASSCVALRDLGRTTGLGWIDPSGSAPFEVYCDQDTAGGGWAVVWKNSGGEVGGEASNADLLEATRDDGAIGPHDETLGSGVNAAAWTWYKDTANTEWLKRGTLWDSADVEVADHEFRVVLGAFTLGQVFGLGSNQPCHDAGNAIEVFFKGTSLGSTNFVNSYQAGRATFGLANDGDNGNDACGQTADNLITDPNDLIYRHDGGDGVNAVRHLFSYRHTAAGRDASRCQFACWDSSNFGGHYDGFSWLAR